MPSSPFVVVLRSYNDPLQTQVFINLCTGNICSIIHFVYNAQIFFSCYRHT
jgi:hypothetical protein